MKLKRGIHVIDTQDNRGWNIKRITKDRGELTIDEIRQAIIASGDQGYYALILKCIDEDDLQYFDDDLPDDAVDTYDAETFMRNSGREK